MLVSSDLYYSCIILSFAFRQNLVERIEKLIIGKYDYLTDEVLLSLIYKNCINTGVFPDIWKKSNSIKGEINRLLIIIDPFLFCLSVVRSLKKFYLTQDANFLKKIIFSVNIIKVSEYQLLSIVHDIYASFDCSPP